MENEINFTFACQSDCSFHCCSRISSVIVWTNAQRKYDAFIRFGVVPGHSVSANWLLKTYDMSIEFCALPFICSVSG